MSPENGINLESVSYFSLKEYVNRINLTKELLRHAEETEKGFNEYMDELNQYCNASKQDFLIETFSDEIIDSNKIENHLISPRKMTRENVFFDSLNISHERIKDLHRFVTYENEEHDYRKIDAWVRRKNGNDETIYWYGASPQDIHKFIDDFIEIYKGKNASEIDNNAFIKSSLVHLLIMRIHPFKEGNGRISRMIQNMKFTELISKSYEYDLKISPIHLSKSILLNKQTYYKRINNIYFDIKHDINKEINNYFEFMLYMFDEQIFYMNNRLILGDLPLFKKEDINIKPVVSKKKKKK